MERRRRSICGSTRTWVHAAVPNYNQMQKLHLFMFQRRQFKHVYRLLNPTAEPPAVSAAAVAAVPAVCAAAAPFFAARSALSPLCFRLILKPVVNSQIRNGKTRKPLFGIVSFSRGGEKRGVNSFRAASPHVGKSVWVNNCKKISEFNHLSEIKAPSDARLAAEASLTSSGKRRRVS